MTFGDGNSLFEAITVGPVAACPRSAAGAAGLGMAMYLYLCISLHPYMFCGLFPYIKCINPVCIELKAK